MRNIRSIICKLTGHKFSAWKFVATNSCKQISRCERCGLTRTQFVHEFNTWEFLGPNSCTQISYCRRCNHKERIISHTFDKDEICGEQRRCLRCGYTYTVGHIWGEIRGSHYPETNEVHCLRCGKGLWLTGYNDNATLESYRFDKL